MKLCLLLLFMVLGCFAIINVRTTTQAGIIADVQIKWQNLYGKQNDDNTLNTVLYQKVSDVTNRLGEIVKISHLQIFLWKEIVFFKC